jgi:hypothetical protein
MVWEKLSNSEIDDTFTITVLSICYINRQYLLAGVAQLVERHPSKVNVAGSNLVSRST